MKRTSILNLVVFAVLFLANTVTAQIGYYDAPYTRYEANTGTLGSGAASTAATFDQWQLQSEASEQVCVSLPATNSYIEWAVTAPGDGLVIRYCVPDGGTGLLDVSVGGTFITTLNLSTYYSWESLWNNGNPNNAGVSNQAPKMRFDEVRYRLPSQIATGGLLRLTRRSGSSDIYVDFAELEIVPPPISSYGSVYGGNGSDLQTYINNNDGGGNTIFLPPGVYNVNSQIYFDAANTTLRGAGMWYTQIHFTNGGANAGGLRANANNVSLADMYLSTVRNSRSNSYKAINGVFTGGATVSKIWAEHFECGAWIAQYSTGPATADNFTVSHCRFRNNYADGINLCRGTKNAIVEHCSFRNNGDDDMAIWSADNMECQNNTFRFNTSENTWRSAGVAIYGGLNNKAQNILIQDNVEVGIKVNNAFGGAGFNGGGMHEFTNILIKRCGTYYDLFNKPVGAIEMAVYSVAGTRVQNVKFSCITILDSKNDAINITKVGGDGFYNIDFENITANGTGREYPNNGGAVGGRGFMLLFKGNPNGDISYCNLNWSNRGGSATTNEDHAQRGALSWNSATCPAGSTCASVVTSSTTITSSAYFGTCTSPITLTANTTAPSGATVSYVEFFVDGSSIGQDNSSPYSMNWTTPTPTIGDHTVYAVANYSNSTTSTSSTQTITVADGIYSTGAAPTIDGTIDALWGNYAQFPLNVLSIGTVSGAADLSAYFKITRDATNLYILVDVTDDDLRNDGGNTYDNDGIELFIDMGNDKQTSYGGTDYQYNFQYNNNTAQPGLTFAQALKTGGYIFEIRIPWATLGGAPAAGSYIGFDLHVDDDDGGGTRDAKKAWEDALDVAWTNPSVLGTLQVAGCSNPLPVSLLNFYGEAGDHQVVLNWSTIAEINNAAFFVERSTNTIDWRQIGEIAGAGNSSAVIHYQYTDNNYSGGTVYYRLKQVDYDGKSNYSDIVIIKTGSELVSISPNPFEQGFMIQSTSQNDLTILIYDVVGRLVYQTKAENVSEGLFVTPELISGTYLVTIQAKDFIKHQKVIKR